MRNELRLFAVAAVLVGYGVFGFDPSRATTRPAYLVGIVLMAICLAILPRAGWRGSSRELGIAAALSVVPVWALYEFVRQEGCPLLGDSTPATMACLGGFGEMTAPVLSAGVAGLIVIVGLLLRRRGRADAMPGAAS